MTARRELSEFEDFVRLGIAESCCRWRQYISQTISRREYVLEFVFQTRDKLSCLEKCARVLIQHERHEGTRRYRIRRQEHGAFSNLCLQITESEELCYRGVLLTIEERTRFCLHHEEILAVYNVCCSRKTLSLMSFSAHEFHANYFLSQHQQLQTIVRICLMALHATVSLYSESINAHFETVLLLMLESVVVLEQSSREDIFNHETTEFNQFFVLYAQQSLSLLFFESWTQDALQVHSEYFLLTIEVEKLERKMLENENTLAAHASQFLQTHSHQCWLALILHANDCTELTETVIRLAIQESEGTTRTQLLHHIQFAEFDLLRLVNVVQLNQIEQIERDTLMALHDHAQMGFHFAVLMKHLMVECAVELKYVEGIVDTCEYIRKLFVVKLIVEFHMRCLEDHAGEVSLVGAQFILEVEQNARKAVGQEEEETRNALSVSAKMAEKEIISLLEFRQRVVGLHRIETMIRNHNIRDEWIEYTREMMMCQCQDQKFIHRSEFIRCLIEPNMRSFQLHVELLQIESIHRNEFESEEVLAHR
eukprot:PhF_6_TR11737/c0_g1_i2/m.19176